MAVIDHSTLEPVSSQNDAPGVDVVLATSDSSEVRLLDGRTLRLIGALHRRFWDRRRELLLARAKSGQVGPNQVDRASDPAALADLAGPGAETWEGRVGEHLRLADVVEQDTPAPGTARVAIRGWEETEPGVLVDGRAVPGCVFDVAVALSTASETLRKDEASVVLVIPEPGCSDETKLWTDLTNVAQDRVGIDRGTITVEEIAGT